MEIILQGMTENAEHQELFYVPKHIPQIQVHAGNRTNAS